MGQRSRFSKISNLGYFWGPFKRVTRISHRQIFDMLWSLTSSVKRSTVCSLVIYITRFNEKTCTRGSRKFQNPLTPETPFSQNSVNRFFPNCLCTGRAPRTTLVTCQISPPGTRRRDLKYFREVKMAKSLLTTTLGAIFSNCKIQIFFKIAESRVRIGYCRLPEIIENSRLRFREKVGQSSSFSKISNLNISPKWGRIPPEKKSHVSGSPGA